MQHTARVHAQSRPVVAALGAFGLAVLFAPTVAVAQAAAPAGVNADTNEVETIIVTARRREESVQSTPVSVTAISPARLEQAAAPDIRDLVGITPNLVVDPVGAGPQGAAISIRGISFEDIEKSFDPSVGVLVDGVYIGTNTGQLLDFFDFKGVEVLRGPQGTLFGRNTTGGVINIIRTDPTGEFGGKVAATIGDYGRQEIRGVLNLPKTGVVSTKLFYFRKESDGYIRNVIRGEREPHSETQNYGVSFLFEPVEEFRANLTVEGERLRSETSQSTLSSNNDLICLRLPLGPGGSLVRATGIPEQQCNRNTTDDLYTSFSNVQGPVRYNMFATSLNWTLNLGQFTVAGVTGYRKSDEYVRQDFDASSINFFDTLREQDYDQFSQELRVSGQITNTLDVVAGVYYFESSYDLHQFTNWGAFLQNAIRLPPQTQAIVGHHAKSEAVFADFDWRFAPQWRLSVGGRYTRDEKRIVNNAIAFIVAGKEDWAEFTPRVSLDFQATEDVLLYGSYARGFRSGGFNGRASSPVAASTPYDPETVDSYELGAKTGWFDNRLLLNIAAFYSNYNDKQEEVVRPTPPGSINAQETIVDNAAKAKIKGVEVELHARPIPRLTIDGSLGLLDAKYDEYRQLDPVTLQPLDLSNLNLRRTPETTASIGFSYHMPTSVGDWTAAASYRYIAPYDTTIVRALGTGVLVNGVLVPAKNDPRGRTQTQDIIDASLTWTGQMGGKSLKASLFGRNLLDDRGLSATLPVAGLFAFGSGRPPRTWGVELGVEF